MKQAIKTEATYFSQALITSYNIARYQNSEYQFTFYRCYKYLASHLLSTENGDRSRSETSVNMYQLVWRHILEN